MSQAGLATGHLTHALDTSRRLLTLRLFLVQESSSRGVQQGSSCHFLALGVLFFLAGVLPLDTPSENSK